MFDNKYWSYSACGEGVCDTFSFKYKLKDSSLTYIFSTTWDTENRVKKLTKDSLVYYNTESHRIFKYSKSKK